MVDFDQHPKYSDFIIHSTSYRTVGDHGIAADVLLPTSLVAALSPEPKKTIPRPIIVRFHGGGLFAGMSLYPDWFPPYLLQYACRNAIPIISADYRLLPESTGLDILDDLSSFWSWIRSAENGLQDFTARFHPDLSINKDCILAEGESAGGYLVVQAALSKLPGLKAVIAAFPMLDLRDEYYTTKFEKVMGGVQMLPESIIDDHLKAMKQGDVVSSVLPPARLDLGTAVIQHGRYAEFLGSDDRLYPMVRLRDAALRESDETRMPRLWIYHGKQDTGIPATGSEKFVTEALNRGVWAKEDLRLDVPDGEHGLHADKELDSTGWLKEGMDWVVEPWFRPLAT